MRRIRKAALSASFLVAISTLTTASAQGREAAAGPQTNNEVTRLLERLDVQPPQHFRGLTIFPLDLRGGGDGAEYLTFDEAVRAGDLRVWDTGRVEGITMENVSRRNWVFAMAGEVVYGGHQNRMLREDALLPPNSGPVVVATYCVEHGRWQGRNERFEGSHALSNYALRSRALAGAPQQEIWDQVEREQRRFGVESPTRDYDAVAASPAVTRELGEYRAAFAPRWQGRTVGFVVAQGRNIVSADVFASSRLFWRLRDKLVGSYAFDCLRRYPERPDWGLRQVDARDFMARLYDTRFRHTRSPGAGEDLEFGGNGVSGNALVYRDDVVHLHVTPGQAIRPVPPPEPMPLPIPRMRE